MKWLLILWPLTGGDFEAVAVLSTRATCEALAVEMHATTGRTYLPCTKMNVDTIAYDIVLWKSQEKL